MHRMNTREYRLLHELFEAGRVLTSADQERFVVERCGSNSELASELWQLLESDREGVLFSDEVLESTRKQVQDLLNEGSPNGGERAPARQSRGPEWIGPYRILRRLGSGGMGVVYEAERLAPRRRVAVKVLRLGLHDDRALARFRLEHQALAKMQHPNVATFLDSGTAEDGTAFVAMEFIDGAVLTDFCDQERMTLRDRVELFARVCDGVAHAHARGILHRDLKPNNVLVSRTDQGEAVPKVIDFGIAKMDEVVEGSLTGQSPIGTPDYMSPEQAGADSDGVDVRTDVYALGAMLYELLTGQSPHPASSASSSSLAEKLRIVREVDAPRPSLCIPEGEEGERIAAARSSDLHRLRRTLATELEWIPQRALRKEPDLRYRSVEEFADDLRRYLRREPLLAGPEHFSYRVRKAYQRHRVTFVASLLVLLSVVAAIVGTVAGFREAVRERIRAENNAQDALDAKAEEEIARGAAEKSRLEEKAARDAAERSRREAEIESYRAGIVAATASLRIHDVGEAKERLAACPEHLRGFEWFVLWAQLDHADLVFPNFGETVMRVAYGIHDGRVAALAKNCTVQVFDARSAESVFESRIPSWNHGSLLFLGDDQWLYSTTGHRRTYFDLSGEREPWSEETGSWDRWVSRSHSRTLHVVDPNSLADEERGQRWMESRDVVTGEVQRFRVEVPLGSHWVQIGDRFLTRESNGLVARELASGEIVSRVSEEFRPWHAYPAPDRRRILVLDQSKQHYRVVNTDTGEVQLQFPAQRTPLPPSFDQRGERLVVFSTENSLTVWDVDQATVISRFPQPDRKLVSMHFLPTPGQLATVARDGPIRVYDYHEGRELEVRHGHEDTIESADWSGNGRSVVTGSQDHSARVWHLDRPLPKDSLRPHRENVSGVVLSPCGRWLLVGHENLICTVVRIADREVIASIRGGTGHGYAPEFTPDGEYFVTGTPVTVRRSADGEVVHELTASGSRSTAYFSADGRRVLAADHTSLKVWDTATGESLLDYQPHEQRVLGAYFSPDGATIVTRSEDRTVKAWDSESGEFRFALGTPDQRNSYMVKYSPCGRWLVTSGYGPELRVWDAQTGARLRTLGGHERAIVNFAIDPHGERVVSCCQDRSARLWNLETGELLHVFDGHRAPVETAAFHPDGTRIVTGAYDGSTRIWDAVHGHSIATLGRQADAVRSVAFDPTGTVLVAGSKDGTVSFWQAAPLR